VRRFGLQVLGRGCSHVFIKKGINTDLQNAHDQRGAPALLEAILRAKWRLARAEKRGASREMRSIKNSGMNPTMRRKTIRWVEPVLWGPGPQGSVPWLAGVIWLGFQAMATAGRSEKRLDRVEREASATKRDLQVSRALGRHGIRLADVVSIEVSTRGTNSHIVASFNATR
jgi:hypothetical protein